jgi:hypothetical protein
MTLERLATLVENRIAFCLLRRAAIGAIGCRSLAPLLVRWESSQLLLIVSLATVNDGAGWGTDDLLLPLFLNRCGRVQAARMQLPPILTSPCNSVKPDRSAGDRW